MTHTRDWWKAVYKNLPLPKALPLNRDGSYKTPPMDVWTTLSDDDAEDGAAAASTEKMSTKKVKESTSKANAKEKKRARAGGGVAAAGRGEEVRRQRGAAERRGGADAEAEAEASSAFALRRARTRALRVEPLDASEGAPKAEARRHLRGCHAFYCSTPFNVGRDGYFEQCRCCSDGHERIVCCDQCSQVFCEPCIANLGGKAYAKDVHDVETWRCFSCDPDAVAKGR